MHEQRNCLSKQCIVIEFLRYYDVIWAIDEYGKEIIYQCLDDYREYCRNEHFHKDNINDYEIVKRIRDNTYYCLYCLLGGFLVLPGKKTEEELLGSIDYEYERFYTAMRYIPIGFNRFIFFMSDGSRQKMISVLDQEIPRYSKRLETPLVFYKVDSFDEFDWEKQQEIIQVTKENCPLNAWLVTKKGDGELIPIEW